VISIYDGWFVKNGTILPRSMIPEAGSSDFPFELSGKLPVPAANLQETVGFGSRNTAPVSGVRMWVLVGDLKK
jgi:hypothetical protein